MNGFEQLASDYQAYQQACAELFEDWQPAAACPVVANRQRQQLDRAALQAQLNALGPAEGWLLLTDRRLSFKQENIGELPATPLEAELYADGQSIRLRTLDDGQWLWVSTRLSRCEAGQATHLATALAHLSVKQGVARLHYQQLWCRNAEGRLHIEDAVFTGFQEFQG